MVCILSDARCFSDLPEITPIGLHLSHKTAVGQISEAHLATVGILPDALRLSGLQGNQLLSALCDKNTRSKQKFNLLEWQDSADSGGK